MKIQIIWVGQSTKGKVHEKKSKKKLTSVSFMYVCVAENAEVLVFLAILHFSGTEGNFIDTYINNW